MINVAKCFDWRSWEVSVFLKFLFTIIYYSLYVIDISLSKIFKDSTCVSEH
jgi:hypothetical protein